MSTLKRRTFLVNSAALALVPTATIAAGHSSLTIGGVSVPTASVADCQDLGNEIAEIDQEIARLQNAPDSEIERWYRNTSSALDKQSGQLKTALDAANAAVAANDAAVERDVIKAIQQSNDLLLASAIQTRNPQFVGAAVGVNVISGTAVFSYQVMTTDSTQKSQGAVFVFANGRKRMLMQLVRNKPGIELAKKQVKMALKLAVTTGKIAANAYKSGELQQDAGAIASDLEALDAQIVGLPVNLQDTREHMIEDLSAQKELYELIDLAPGCQINQTPAPLPLPGLG